jgi:hypothetical protein
MAMPELRHLEKLEQHIQRGTRKQQRRGEVIKYLKEIGLEVLTTRSVTPRRTNKWKTCKDDTMTTPANELGEREEKGKQDKETEGKTNWTWICTSNDDKNEISF